jgi:hypothetical protein
LATTGGRRKKIPSGFEGKGGDEILGAMHIHTKTVTTEEKWSQSSKSSIHSLRLLTTMQANASDTSKTWTIVYPDATTSGPSGRPSQEEEEQRSTKPKRVTLEDPPAVVPATPPASPVRSMQKIIVEDLRSEDEGTLVKALDDLGSVHLDTDRDDLDLKTAVEEFIYCGGNLAVSWIMEKHPDCKEIQRNGMEVFIGAAYLDSTNVEKQLGNTRALHVVYAAIQRFPEDTIILSKGFGALNNLTCDCESNCKILVDELDALPFLVERMESPLVSNADVAQNCCGMLHSISEFPQMRRRMIKAKALSALSHAVENHEENVDIQEWANEALLALLSSHETTDDQNDQSQSSPRPGS